MVRPLWLVVVTAYHHPTMTILFPLPGYCVTAGELRQLHYIYGSIQVLLHFFNIWNQQHTKMPLKQSVKPKDQKAASKGQTLKAADNPAATSKEASTDTQGNLSHEKINKPENESPSE